MYKDSKLKKCTQCQSYYNSYNDNSMDLCEECMKDIRQALEEEYEKENELSYKKTCEEAAGTNDLNKDQIFMKLSKAASTITDEGLVGDKSDSFINVVNYHIDNLFL